MNWQLVPSNSPPACSTAASSPSLPWASSSSTARRRYSTSPTANWSCFGAFVTWWFAGGEETGNELFNLPLWGHSLAVLAMAGLGLLIERLARADDRPAAAGDRAMTLGLAQFLEGSAAIVFGIQPKNNFLPSRPATSSPSHFRGLQRRDHHQAGASGTAICSRGGGRHLHAVLPIYVSAGMRATSEDHELATASASTCRASSACRGPSPGSSPSAASCWQP